MGPDILVEDLRKDLAAGRVLVVVGTGVSIQASGNDARAGWSGLILDGINHCVGVGMLTADEANALRDKLEKHKNDRNTLLAVAERIQTLLDEGELREWLQKSVGKLPLRDREIIDAIHSLEARLATTNYDDLLSRGRPLTAVPWTNLPFVLELIKEDRKGILHFHGYYDVPESVVLGVRSYQKILEERGAQDIQKIVAAHNTLLFIGCGSEGLADPNFGALLEWCESLFGSSKYRHYCLCRTSESQALKAKYKSLSFVEYGDNYEDLSPALRALAPPKFAGSTLPTAGYCFGRDKEVKELISKLLEKKTEPIPILGGPGMGKTTIALKAMNDKRVATRFGTRRWFVRCDGVRTRAELAAAIARAIGIEITPNVETSVLTELANGQAAFVIDNAETPLDAERQPVEDFLSLLATIESLALVVTIRAQKRPATVAWGSTIEVNPLSDKAARTAFVAAAGRRSFAKDPRLSRLLSVLDGVPLAITLMGRFAESFKSLELVWERWNAKKTATMSTGLDRLTNIQKSYELSIEVLSSEARRFLSVLAMLPDGVANVDLPGIFKDPEHATDELRERALIEQEEKRVRMLAPLREYVVAAHVAEAADESRAVDHYLALAAHEGAKVGAMGGAEAVARLAPEVANMETMLGGSGVVGSSSVIQAVYGWGEFMRFAGLGSATVIERLNERSEAANLMKVAARCLLSLGDIALHRSEHDAARYRYEKALPIYHQTGDWLGEANCVKGLGDIALERSDHDTARDRYQEALPLYRKADDLLGEANCIRRLGHIALERSDHDMARDRFQEALPLYRKINDLLGEANCVMSLGDIAFADSDFVVAKDQYYQALPLYRRVGSPRSEAYCVKSLGDIALRGSDFATAWDRYHEALRLFRSVGDPLGEANCIRSFGDIALSSQNRAEAGAHYWEALGLYERIAEPYSIGETRRRLAHLTNKAERAKGPRGRGARRVAQHQAGGPCRQT